MESLETVRCARARTRQSEGHVSKLSRHFVNAHLSFHTDLRRYRVRRKKPREDVSCFIDHLIVVILRDRLRILSHDIIVIHVYGPGDRSQIRRIK